MLITVSLDSNDPRPAYVQLADVLRAQIHAGLFKPGGQLPPGRELAKEHSIAPMTVRQAIKVLSDEGVVVSRQGVGVFVRSDVVQSSVPGLDINDRILTELRSIREEIAGLAQRIAALEGDR